MSPPRRCSPAGSALNHGPAARFRYASRRSPFGVRPAIAGGSRRKVLSRRDRVDIHPHGGADLQRGGLRARPIARRCDENARCELTWEPSGNRGISEYGFRAPLFRDVGALLRGGSSYFVSAIEL
jgi:hypothetical protein